jgi:hypothetical protein
VKSEVLGQILFHRGYLETSLPQSNQNILSQIKFSFPPLSVFIPAVSFPLKRYEFKQYRCLIVSSMRAEELLLKHEDDK